MIGTNRVQFTGAPKYACDIQDHGFVLSCDGGRRIWVKR